MRKNLVILAAALAAAAALTACGGQAEETTAAETAAETTAEESAEAEETSAEEETEAAKADGELETVTVGASPAPHAEILEAAKEAMAEKGYDLEIVEYVDYVQPNLALDSGDLTANYFQHITYLEDFNAERGPTWPAPEASTTSPSASTPARPLPWRSWRTAPRLQFPTTPPTRPEPFCSWRPRA